MIVRKLSFCRPPVRILRLIQVRFKIARRVLLVRIRSSFNKCMSSSSCRNTGSTDAIIDSENGKSIDQKLDQKNFCINGSTCSNTGTVTGGSDTNTQSNLCKDGSSCNNSGQDNKTLCVDSARL